METENELLILVDTEDREIGSLGKDQCHDGEGVLHRAFSLFLFNDKGELLLQRRSEEKRLWPRYWSNSCCSHPRQNEDMQSATLRRLKEELDITTALTFIFNFQYDAQYENKGSEREICSVYIGKSNGPITANRTEIAAWKFCDLHLVDIELSKNSEYFTPWFRIEWDRIRESHMRDIEKMLANTVGGNI